MKKKAYLDWRNFHRQFDFLRQMGFVEEIDDTFGGPLYELTERGERFKVEIKGWRSHSAINPYPFQRVRIPEKQKPFI